MSRPQGPFEVKSLTGRIVSGSKSLLIACIFPHPSLTGFTLIGTLFSRKVLCFDSVRLYMSFCFHIFLILVPRAHFSFVQHQEDGLWPQPKQEVCITDFKLFCAFLINLKQLSSVTTLGTFSLIRGWGRLRVCVFRSEQANWKILASKPYAHAQYRTHCPPM